MEPKDNLEHSKDAVLLAYQALRERRLAYDAMMWQSPALGVAAQSFLLSIAFDAEKGVLPTLVCSLLSIGLGLCSLQLMLKHRHHQLLTTRALHEMEVSNDLIEVHKRPESASVGDYFHWATNFSSFRLWMFGILATTGGGVIAALIALSGLGPSC